MRKETKNTGKIDWQQITWINLQCDVYTFNVCLAQVACFAANWVLWYLWRCFCVGGREIAVVWEVVWKGMFRSWQISSICINQPSQQGKEGSVLFKDVLNTFYLWLYGVRHMVKRGNLLLPHGLLFLISSKGSFICIIPQTG